MSESPPSPAAPTAPTEPTEPTEPTAVLDPVSAAIAPGYAFEGPALELGGLMLDATELSDVRIRIPLAMRDAGAVSGECFEERGGVCG